MEKIIVTGEDLSFEDVIKVACENAEVELGSLDKVQESVDYINRKVAEGAIIYGVTTGFGANADKVIKPEDAKRLQVNLLRSHSTGVGKNFSCRMVRAIMLIRLNTLLKGYSGVQVSTVKQIRDFLNHQIHPVIPEQGSVGASGDLCPLSHMALPLIGESYVEYKGKEYKTAELFELTEIKEADLKPIELSYKEGLALNNGTTVMAALGVFAIYEFERLLKLATLTTSLMLEAFGARREAFDAKLQRVRNHPGQIEIAGWIRTFTENSTFFGISSERLKSASKQEGDLLDRLAEMKKIPQNAYSFRCVPQVFGASLQALEHAREIFKGEVNATVDNPLIFVEEDEVIAGGNFHGQPVALVLDYLKIAISEIGNIVERQVNKLMDEATNHELESFLTYDDTGVVSGLMVTQYVAASLVSENKVLAHPASADSIPTSANVEDHVSMGTIAGRQALEILENVKQVIIIAVLSAHHAMQIRQNQYREFGLEAEMAQPTAELFEAVKEAIPDFRVEGFLKQDRFTYDDLKKLGENYEKFAAIAEDSLGKS